MPNYNALLPRAFTGTRQDVSQWCVPEHDVRAPFRTVVNRGAHRQAIRFFADLTQIFDWARKRQPSDFG